MFIKCAAVPDTELTPQLGSFGDSAPPADLAELAVAATSGAELTNEGVRSCQCSTFTGKSAAASSATAELSLLFSLVCYDPPAAPALPRGFVLHLSHSRTLGPGITVPWTLLMLQENTTKSTDPNLLKKPQFRTRTRQVGRTDTAQVLQSRSHLCAIHSTAQPAPCSDFTSIFLTDTDFWNILKSSKQGRFEDRMCACRQGWAEANSRGFYRVAMPIILYLTWNHIH